MGGPGAGLGELGLVARDLVLGFRELLGVLGREARVGLVDVAPDPRQARFRFAELSRLGGERRGLRLQQFERVDYLGARLRVHRQQGRAHLDALLKGADQNLLRRDGGRETPPLRGLLAPLPVEAAQRAGELGDVVRQHALFAGRGGRRRVGREGKRRRGAEVPLRGQRERRGAAHHLGPPGVEVGLDGALVGAGLRGVERQQHLARPDGRPVLGRDGRHLAGFERLNGLGAADRLYLALRGRDDVDAPEPGPADRRGREGADRQDHGGADRRGRRFQDLERRGEELVVAALDQPRTRGGLARRLRLGNRDRKRGHAFACSFWRAQSLR